MPPAMTATTTPEPSSATVTSPEQQTPPAAPPMDSSGFYRLQGEQLQFAPNAVHAPGYALSRENREALELPHDGWQWFDTSEAAHAHHGLPLPQPAVPETIDSQADGQPWGPRRKHPGAGPRGVVAGRQTPTQATAS